MNTFHTFFATVPRHMEQLLQEELEALGGQNVRQTVAGVFFSGKLEMGYRACLWSRLANAVLLPLHSFYAPTPEALYDGVRTINWDEHMDVDSTLAVTFHSQGSKITHTQFGALKVKDAVVDQFRDRFDRRPSVDVKNPDLHINVHVMRDEATISIDLSGDSLHRRAYRQQTVEAPLKENAAAALLIRAGWPKMVADTKEQLAKDSGQPIALVDPMCGSGTLLIEGALMAADIAPGLLRTNFGFLKWLQHDETIWQNLVEEAELRRTEGLKNLPTIVPTIAGYDREGSAIRAARTNVQAAGLERYIFLEVRSIQDATPPKNCPPTGLLVVNPPYGERLGRQTGVETLHKRLGETLLQHFDGWNASVLTGSKELGRHIGIRALKFYKLFNGRLECTLLNFEIDPSRAMHPSYRPPPAPRNDREKNN